MNKIKKFSILGLGLALLISSLIFNGCKKAEEASAETQVAAQKTAAEKSKLAAADRFKRPVVTEIVPLKKFYQAEDYHQDFFRKNPSHPYCVAVIHPKLKKIGKPKLD